MLKHNLRDYVTLGLRKHLKDFAADNVSYDSTIGCGQRLRDAAVERLEAEGIVCGRKDFLLSGGTGYRLAESIVIRGEAE